MSGILGFLSNLLPFKDGGAIPPSNAMQFKKPWMPQGPKPQMMPPDFLRTFYGKRLFSPVPKKKGGAVKKKGKKRK
jgi:hypothetical protein